MKTLNNQSGFTLVEILIAAGMLSMLALGFATYMFNVSKQQKHVEEKNNFAMLSTSIHAASIDAQTIFSSKDAQVQIQAAAANTGNTNLLSPTVVNH